MLFVHIQRVPPMNDFDELFNNCSPCDPQKPQCMQTNITIRGNDLATERHKTNLNVITLFVGAVVASSSSTGRHGDLIEAVS